MTYEEYQTTLENAKSLITTIIPMSEKQIDELASYIVGYKKGYEDKLSI